MGLDWGLVAWFAAVGLVCLFFRGVGPN